MTVASKEGVRIEFGRKTLPIVWARSLRNGSPLVLRAISGAHGGEFYTASEDRRGCIIQGFDQDHSLAWTSSVNIPSCVVGDLLSGHGAVIVLCNSTALGGQRASVHLFDQAGSEVWSANIPGRGGDLIGKQLAFSPGGDILAISGDIVSGRDAIASIVAYNRDGRLLWDRHLNQFDPLVVATHPSSDTLFIAGIVPHPHYRSLAVKSLSVSSGKVRWTRDWPTSDWINRITGGVTQSGTFFLAGTVLGGIRIPHHAIESSGRKRPAAFVLAVTLSGKTLGADAPFRTRSPVNVVATVLKNEVVVATVTTKGNLPPSAPLTDMETDVVICDASVECKSLASMKGHVWGIGGLGANYFALIGMIAQHERLLELMEVAVPNE